MNTEPTLRLLLVRHGETDWSQEGRFCGRSDPPLNEAGGRQVQRLAERLRDKNIAIGYTSPARRACQTADTLRAVAHPGVTFIRRIELQEQDFGEWEGRQPEDVAESDPALWADWQSGKVAAPPGGESLPAVAERALRWVSEVTLSHTGETVAAVSHGGVLQAMLCKLLGTALRPLWPYRLAAAGMAEVWLYPAGAVLVSLNNPNQ